MTAIEFTPAERMLVADRLAQSRAIEVEAARLHAQAKRVRDEAITAVVTSHGAAFDAGDHAEIDYEDKHPVGVRIVRSKAPREPNVSDLTPEPTDA